jgi:hypothetical protein
MTAKHTGLLMCALGAACVFTAMRMPSGYENGKFIGQIIVGFAGCCLIVAGLVTAIFG